MSKKPQLLRRLLAMTPRVHQRTVIDQEHLDRLYSMARDHSVQVSAIAQSIAVHQTQDEERWKSIGEKWETIEGVLVDFRQGQNENRRTWLTVAGAVIGLLFTINMALIAYVWTVR